MAAGQGKVYLGKDALARFGTTLATAPAKVLVLTDHHTATHCLPLVAAALPAHLHFSVPPGESSKSISTCLGIWGKLTAAAFERGDAVINLGGGMVCDLGGFAASCFKRGIHFMHMPTTLLAMADAAIGGKTGINFEGFKNQIGSFQQPRAVVIHTPFLGSLPERELRAGYAEVLKHYLIHDRAAWEIARQAPDLPLEWGPTVDKAVKIKLHFTEMDPTEKGIRKALNFGHTIGHAIESHFLHEDPDHPLLHGEAVAAGMACEAILSHQRQCIDSQGLSQILDTIHRIFGAVGFQADAIPAISRWCLQDKKNAGGRVNATLLDGIGGFALDQWLSLEEIEGSLRIYLAQFTPRNKA